MADAVDKLIDLNHVRGLQVQLKIGSLSKIFCPQMKAEQSSQGPRTLRRQAVRRVVEVSDFTRTDRMLNRPNHCKVSLFTQLLKASLLQLFH